MFTHIDTKYNVDLIAEMIDGVRYYLTPEGNYYPSVTSVLSYKDRHKMDEWKNRVGHAEAERISKQSAGDGTLVHSMIEDHLNNKLDLSQYKNNIVPFFLFNNIKRELENITDIHMLEGSLYSDILKVAGRVDCIANYKGELSIIDFKTSRTEKKEEWIQNYFIQESVYAMMFYERTNIKVKKLVTIITCKDGSLQTFEKYDIIKYSKMFNDYLQEWKSKPNAKNTEHRTLITN